MYANQNVQRGFIVSKKPKPINHGKIDNTTKHFQGIGYHIPKSYNKSEVLELYKLWNEKLQKSGHRELEHFSSLQPGRSSPFFVEAHNQGIYKESNYTISAFYNLIQTYINYYMLSNESRERYKLNWPVYQLLIQDFAAGKSLITLVDQLKTWAFYNRLPSKNTASRAYGANKGRSKYWTYISLRKILNHCWLWHITDLNGELAAKDLEHLDFLGLDVPGTEELINSLPATIEPIKLRIKSKALYKNDKPAKI